jgi:signal transduction histidine kinase
VTIVVLAVVVIDLAILVTGVVLFRSDFFEAGWEITIWLAAVAAVGLAAIETPAGPQLGMDMPLLLAAGYVLGPIPAGVLAVAGYVDVREFRGEITLDRALFNRAQTSLCVTAASSVFEVLPNGPTVWPLAIPVAILAVAVDSLLNYGLIAGVVALAERVTPKASLARLRFGSALEFVGTYVCFGLLSLLLAETYNDIGAWALLLFVMPLALARRAFAQSEALASAQTRLSAQGVAIREASERIVDERKDERLSIAAGLHDDVLPPLFKVHLMGQVLRQELATGRLLAMEDDLPELIRATDEASGTVRSLIRDLRTSPLGTAGLSRTLQLLVRDLSAKTDISLEADIEEVAGSPVVDLLTYQVAREALRNAIRHSQAGSVRLSLRRDGSDIRLVVEDDGVGFSQLGVDTQHHFGLALMKERVELGGGLLQVDTAVGSGTRVIARLPAARQS